MGGSALQVGDARVANWCVADAVIVASVEVICWIGLEVGWKLAVGDVRAVGFALHDVVRCWSWSMRGDCVPK